MKIYRFLSLLLLLLMLACCENGTTIINQEVVSNYFVYKDFYVTIVGNEAKIVEFKGLQYDVVIPDYVENSGKKYPVTRIGSRAFADQRINSVTFPNTLKYIDDEAFMECKQLSSISLPSSLQAIGKRAFMNSALENVVLPSNLQYIEEETFMDCRKLSSITLPSSLKKIGKRAFMNAGLVNVVLPSKLQYIEEETFMDCSKLSSITLPSSLEAIGKRAFINSGLENVVMSSKLQYIEEETFKDCSKLSSITLPSSLEVIGKRAFINSGLENVVLPSKLQYIEEESFMDCRKLSSITLPSSLEVIGKRAFFNTKLIEINIPSVNTIEVSAFASNKYLKKVTINSMLETIEENAFKDCDNLENVTLPNSLEYIGNYAFANTSISDFSLPSGSLGEGVLFNCPLKSLHIGGKVKEIPFDFCYINIAGYSRDNNIQSLTLSEGIEIINSNAFEYCKLSQIEIPNSVKTISNFAFRGNTKLKTVIFGSGLQEIGVSAFENVNDVTNVSFYSASPPSIIGFIYWRCTIHVPESSLELYRQKYRNTFINCTIYDYVAL